MAAEASMSMPSPDSYIGSLISLTSKSEIRYEGILYKINTEESSIELRNVQSFGTEGRKKDGLQIPASDKIYEYILFRGSDIKDLQVKASAPVQTAPAYNDPAIIQSNFPHPPAAPLSLPSLGTVSTTEISSHTAQVGIQRPTFQGNPTPYPTCGNLGPWGSTPPSLTSNCSGHSVPMYWQGCYAPPGGFPLMRPLPGIAVPPMQQTSQFEDPNASVSSGPLFPQLSSSLTLIPASLPSAVASIQAMPFSLETLQVSVPNKVSTTSLSEVATNGSLPPAPHVTSGMEKNIPCVVSSKNRIGPFASMALHIETQSTPVLGTSSSKKAELPINLVTPSQLMQPTQAYVLPLGKISEEVKIERSENTSKPVLPEPPNLEPESKIKPHAIAKEPILPLPRQAYHKPNGAVSAALESHGELGRGSGPGNEYARPQAKFTEDFDFSAMNEKFNKDQVWGHLGKSRSHSSGRNEEEEADGFEEGISHSLSSDIKPVYVKDDFFDTISCNSNSSRIRFSEQLKIDTQTFGNFPRLRPPYVGARGHRGGGGGGGGRGRGLYHGRGYGYPARGRD